MSISVETAKEHLNDPAVLCCRREKGKLLEASDLEDPTLFPDYEDSGLLELPDNVLTIGQVLGATLNKTMDALLPLTPDVVSPSMRTLVKFSSENADVHPSCVTSSDFIDCAELHAVNPMASIAVRAIVPNTVAVLFIVSPLMIKKLYLFSL